MYIVESPPDNLLRFCYRSRIITSKLTEQHFVNNLSSSQQHFQNLLPQFNITHVQHIARQPHHTNSSYPPSPVHRSATSPRSPAARKRAQPRARPQSPSAKRDVEISNLAALAGSHGRARPSGAPRKRRPHPSAIGPRRPRTPPVETALARERRFRLRGRRHQLRGDIVPIRAARASKNPGKISAGRASLVTPDARPCVVNCGGNSREGRCRVFFQARVGSDGGMNGFFLEVR